MTLPLLTPEWDETVRQAALVAPVDRHGRLLLQLREARDGIAAPGLWSFFGGGFEAGETPLEALVREVEEEIGLRPALSDLNPIGRALGVLTPKVALHCWLWRFPHDLSDIRLKEGAGFGVFHEPQLEDLPLNPSLAPVLAWLTRGGHLRRAPLPRPSVEEDGQEADQQEQCHRYVEHP
ncbi:NUDIX domain-containing protein [Paracoccaceae bacterium GXU_MW_L88]